MKLSYIVPIYRVEVYLHKCIDSILSQGLPEDDYEVILVDDGSPDKCGEICDRYAAQHPNIHVIHQPNGGLSAARNAGLKIAQGQYIWFVDSDDYLEPNVTPALLEQIERDQLDVLRFKYHNVNEDYKVYWPYKTPQQVDHRTDVSTGMDYLNQRLGMGCYAWQFIIRKNLIPDFKPGIHFEDTEWTPRMLLGAKCVSATDKVCYNYLLRSGSITGAQTREQKRKNIDDQLIVIATLNTLLHEHPSCTWLYEMRSSMAAACLTSVALSLYPERKDYIRKMKELGCFPLSTHGGSTTYLRRAKWINLSPLIYSNMMNLLKCGLRARKAERRRARRQAEIEEELQHGLISHEEAYQKIKELG